jgi:hypothetical protein
MKFLSAYLRNLLILILIIAGSLIFLRIFYPDTLPLISTMGSFYGALKLWPIIILALLIFAMPRRSRRR